MRNRLVGAVVLLAGCFHNNSGNGNGDGGGDGPIDSPFDPCILQDITLTAATLSGCASAGTMDGVRGVAHFSNPVNLVLGPEGIAYVADFDSSLIRKVDTDGTVTTIVNRPDLARPFGMILTPDGYIYLETDDDDLGVHSSESGTIWKVNPSNGDAMVILRDHERPRGLALLPNGQLAMCDYVHHTVELLNPVTGVVTPLAGVNGILGYNNSPNGKMALFAQPWDLVLNTDGDLIVSEFQNNRLRRVTLAGAVTNFAGNGVQGHVDGPVATAEFFNPKGMTIDASGAIYVSEAGNHDIRKIANGMVTTVAGVTAGGYLDNADPLQAAFYGVEGLDVSADGTRVVIADGNNGDMMPFNHVRELTETP